MLCIAMKGKGHFKRSFSKPGSGEFKSGLRQPHKLTRHRSNEYGSSTPETAQVLGHPRDMDRVCNLVSKTQESSVVTGRLSEIRYAFGLDRTCPGTPEAENDDEQTGGLFGVDS